MNWGFCLDLPRLPASTNAVVCFSLYLRGRASGRHAPSPVALTHTHTLTAELLCVSSTSNKSRDSSESDHILCPLFPFFDSTTFRSPGRYTPMNGGYIVDVDARPPQIDGASPIGPADFSPPAPKKYNGSTVLL